MTPLVFDVAGVPVPQGSAKAFNRKGGGQPIVTHDAKGLAGWRNDVAKAARDAKRGDTTLLMGPVAIRITFRLSRPASHASARGGCCRPRRASRSFARPRQVRPRRARRPHRGRLQGRQPGQRADRPEGLRGARPPAGRPHRGRRARPFRAERARRARPVRGALHLAVLVAALAAGVLAFAAPRSAAVYPSGLSAGGGIETDQRQSGALSATPRSSLRHDPTDIPVSVPSAIPGNLLAPQGVLRRDRVDRDHVEATTTAPRAHTHARSGDGPPAVAPSAGRPLRPVYPRGRRSATSPAPRPGTGPAARGCTPRCTTTATAPTFRPSSVRSPTARRRASRSPSSRSAPAVGGRGARTSSTSRSRHSGRSACRCPWGWHVTVELLP
jgi:hypothetical protein